MLHGRLGGNSANLWSLQGPQGAQDMANTAVRRSQRDARNRRFVYLPKTRRWQVWLTRYSS